MKKITITNAYTWDNKGDAGILLGIIEELKYIYNGDVMFTILSFTPQKDEKHYCEDNTIKKVYSNVLNPHPYKHTKIGKIKAMIKLAVRAIKISIGLKLNRKNTIKREESLQVLDESDIIIVCGGGFLGGKKLESLMHLYQIDMNTKFNKPVFVMGTSIEPIKNKVIKYYTEKVLKKVDFVYAREEITEKYLNTFLPNEKHMQIPDMAFMLGEKYGNVPFLDVIKKQGKILIGITVRKWNFPNSIDPENSRKKYKNELVKFIENTIEKYNAVFIFIPQVIVDYASDVDIAKEIKQELQNKYQSSFIIREDDWTPVQIKNVIGQLDFFVGTRMHSNIFATSMKIPTLAIAYEKKTNGIMKSVGLENYVEEIDEITSESLTRKFENVVNNKQQISYQLRERILKIKEEIDKKIREQIK